MTENTEIESFSDLLRSIYTCCLPRLPNDCDVGDHQAHYRAHQTSLSGRVEALRRRLADTDVSCYSPEKRVDILSAVLGLIHELQSKGPWSPEGFANYAQTIEEAFTSTNNGSLDGFPQNAGEYRQEIFDSYVASINKKLTADEWKKYPATVQVYCDFCNNIQEYHNLVELDPVKILAAALHLIDDFNSANKLNGLECCLAVLKCLDEGSFKSSNYQQVIYEILKKVIRDQDLEILKLSFSCIAQLIPLFSSIAVESKWDQFDTLLKDIIDDIYLQTNLCRKAVCFEFLAKLIAIRKVNCVRCKKSFDLVICDNLELCTADNVRLVLLPNVLQALKMWLKYCWVMWSYELDKRIVSLLLKLLYIQCSDKATKEIMDELEVVIICTISLCTAQQQETILDALNRGVLIIENEMYKERLVHIQHSLKREAEPGAHCVGIA